MRKKVLNEFIEKYKHTAEQGTIEWLNSRIFRIGGSEISTVLGKNPYSNEKKLIRQHVGLDNFTGYPATWFGNLFEPILIDYVNNYFNCNIIETGSINTDKNLGYSPDGIAIINKENLDNILKEEHYHHIKNTTIFDNFDDNNFIILFEFKCPYKRLPDKTEIPEYYLPQPLLGMEIIDICEVGIFIEALYRFCSMDDIKYNNIYNNEYHNDKNILTTNPICYGCMVITYTAEYESEDDEDMDFLDKIENQSQFIHDVEQYLNNYNNDIKINIKGYEINDLGKITNKWLLNRVLEHIISKKHFKYRYISHNINHKFEYDIYDKSNNVKNIYNYDIQKSINSEIKDILDNLNENENIIGILPYKLFDIYMKPVNKQLNFITNDIQKKVDNIINIIKECHTGNKTIEEKEIIIKKYY